MKRLVTFLCLAVLTLAGCQLSPTGQGYIRILIRPVGSKSLGAAFASAHSNFYTVLAYNADRVVTLSVTDIQTDNVITVPVGTYHVVVLAGDNLNNGNIIFFGSGYVSEVGVVESATTSVNVALHSIDLELTVPSEVPAGSDLTVHLVYDTNSPVLDVAYPGFVYLSDNAQHYLTGSFSGANGYNHFDGSVTFSAPGATGSETLGYADAYVELRDDSVGQQFGLSSLGQNWMLPYSGLADSSISGLVTFPINIIAAAQGIQVIATWAD